MDLFMWELGGRAVHLVPEMFGRSRCEKTGCRGGRGSGSGITRSVNLIHMEGIRSPKACSQK
jgi:hypothetical protein